MLDVAIWVPLPILLGMHARHSETRMNADQDHSPRQAAQQLPLHYRTIINMCQDGRIRATRDRRGGWRIPQSEIERILAERTERISRAVGQFTELARPHSNATALVEQTAADVSRLSAELAASQDTHAEFLRLVGELRDAIDRHLGARLVLARIEEADRRTLKAVGDISDFDEAKADAEWEAFADALEQMSGGKEEMQPPNAARSAPKRR
jgi:excisionase family DNA binding protein